MDLEELPKTASLEQVTNLMRGDKSWRGAECKLVQPRILATKTGPHGRKHRTLPEEEGFDFRESAARRLVPAELRRFSPDSSVTVHLPDVCCRSGVSLKSPQKAANHWSIMCAV